jgi:hypothetical protein
LSDRLVALLVVFTALLPGTAPAEEPGHPALLKKMLAAIQANDYDTFVADGDPAFKAALTTSVFRSGTSRVVPRLAGGYTPTYLGSLSQGGFSVFLWKLSFKDGTDDLLVKLALKNGKVGGFVFQ